MYEQWVIDASMGWPPCLVPVEGNILTGEFQIISGLAVLASKPPSGKIVGIIHEKGQDAADVFSAQYGVEIAEMLKGDI